MRVLAACTTEQVISLVLLSIHTDTSARITRASTHGENDLLAGSRKGIGETSSVSYTHLTLPTIYSV